MLTAVECHKTFLDALLNDPPIARVRLVARFGESPLANADSKTLYVFIPDMHLVSDEQVVRYSYQFNQWETFYRMLFRIQDARSALGREGNLLDVIQLGDLCDLWREGTIRPDTIIEDHLNLLGMLYRHEAGLLARIIVGNHDADMIGTDRYYLRLFLPDEAARAFCLTIHGDWFDPVEQLPDWLQRFGVYFAGTAPQSNDYPLGEIKDVLRRESEASNGFRDRIRLTKPAPIGTLRGISSSGANLPLNWNIRRTSRKDDVHPFLAGARGVVHKYRDEANASLAWSTVRLVVIGHSHFARISVDDTTDPQHPVVLMDCGAWIERYKDKQGSVQPNCQVGVVAGNDIRIYQLDPL